MQAEKHLHRIQTLSRHLANQIAAGEVVERPASVVKELLENSMDAGARQVQIDVEAGGSRLIRIRDDGQGIHHDDLALALSPHATSKLSTHKDLEAIHSLGFRGEALASISSVSRLRLESCLRGDTQGWSLEGGQGAKAKPAAIGQGTQIEVRDLFYNVPARRKFLRTERTESLYIEEVIRGMALSYFDCGFEFRQGERRVFQLRPAGDEAGQLRRLGQLYGKAFADHARRIDCRAAGMRLHGWIGDADLHRSQSDLQYFFVNRRMVKDKVVNHAIRQAYSERLPPGRHPLYLLYLDLDPALVDVNVHPTKHEVRFRESRMVHDFIGQTLRRLLGEGGEEWMPEQVSEGQDSHVAMGSHGGNGQGHARGARVADRPSPYQVKRQLQGLATLSRTVGEQKDSHACQAQALLAGRYILAREGQSHLLVDGAALRRYLTTLKLEQQLQQEPLNSAPLLLPQSSTCSQDQLAMLDVIQGQLQALGIVIDAMGEQSVVLRELPALCRGVEGATLIERLLQVLAPLNKEGNNETRLAMLIEVLADAVADSPLEQDLSRLNKLLAEMLHYQLRDKQTIVSALTPTTLARLFEESEA